MSLTVPRDYTVELRKTDDGWLLLVSAGRYRLESGNFKSQQDALDFMVWWFSIFPTLQSEDVVVNDWTAPALRGLVLTKEPWPTVEPEEPGQWFFDLEQRLEEKKRRERRDHRTLDELLRND